MFTGNSRVTFPKLHFVYSSSINADSYLLWGLNNKKYLLNSKNSIVFLLSFRKIGSQYDSSSSKRPLLLTSISEDRNFSRKVMD